MSAGMMTREVVLTPVVPYDFAQALAYVHGAHWAILERCTEDTYRRALRLLDRDVLLELQASGTPTALQLRLRVTAAAIDDALLAAAEAQIRRTFMLDVDPAPFLALAAGDPIFAEIARTAAMFRPIIIASPYEALLWAIIGQQINVAFAATLKRALVALAGRTLEVDGQSYPLLPEPAALATLDPLELRARQFSGQKTAYLIGVAQAIMSSEIDFAQLATQPAEDAIATLTRHKGIGRWTAECVLMRGLGARDVIPAGDIGLRAAIGRAYALSRHASEDEVRQRAESWVGWRGWATFYWWQSLQIDHKARQAE